ncbi:uncharacterized protein LOC114523097 isoform X2 [Dendronephthya gigantea]|uniref:uncharacterized protein LOC114523097 isoform X2 n=1 Tax=Dendronephthya gigantea TaxID=151771 RepID=UPI00106A73B4|nr:uncharacterized protein LOC114523097 isoform X2 [Dendronephthya gigantea]
MKWQWSRIDVDWPSGGYGLPKPKSGCPISKTSVWSEGWRLQDMEDIAKASRLSNGSHLHIEIIGRGIDLNRTFCIKQNLTGIQRGSWPNGEYCIYKSEDSRCPEDMSSGWVKWNDEDWANANNKGGSLPQGVYNNETLIHYCCQTNGKWSDSIELPVNQPFYLLTTNSVETPKCQMVKWANSRLEYVVFDTEKMSNGEFQKGDHVFIKPRRKVYYCYYERCHRTMKNVSSGSFESYPAPATEMDPRSQYCSWLITIPAAFGAVSLNFSEMTIPSCDDSFLRIYDGGNAKAPLLGSYCGSNASAQVKINSSTNSLYVVANSGRHGKNGSDIFSFQAQYHNETSTTSTKGSVDNFSELVIIILTVGVFLVLVLVIIVVLVKYKQRKTIVNNAIEIGEHSLGPSQEPVRSDDEIVCEAQVQTSPEELTSPENYSAYVIPLQPEQSYAVPADQNTGPYEDLYVISSEPNLPVYTQLDACERDKENYYQKLVHSDEPEQACVP